MEQQGYVPKYMRQLRDDAVLKAVYGMLDCPAAEVEILRADRRIGFADSSMKTGLTREEIKASLDEFVQGSGEGIEQALGAETRIVLRQPYRKQYHDTLEVCFSRQNGIYFKIDGRVGQGMQPKGLPGYSFLALVRELGSALAAFKAVYHRQFQAGQERVPDSRHDDQVIEQLKGIPTDGSYEPPDIDWNLHHRHRQSMNLSDMLEEQQEIEKEKLRDIKEHLGRQRKDYRRMKKVNPSGRGR